MLRSTQRGVGRPPSAVQHMHAGAGQQLACNDTDAAQLPLQERLALDSLSSAWPGLLLLLPLPADQSGPQAAAPAAPRSAAAVSLTRLPATQALAFFSLSRCFAIFRYLSLLLPST